MIIAVYAAILAYFDSFVRATLIPELSTINEINIPISSMCKTIPNVIFQNLLYVYFPYISEFFVFQY